MNIDWSGNKVDIDCQTPRWVKIPNGGTIFAYKDLVPTEGWLCEEEIRTCKKWVLDGSFEFSSCLDGGADTNSWNESTDLTGSAIYDGWIPANGASCETPRWQTIKNGNYIVSYQSPSSCTFQRRLCVDGVLYGKFQYNYCILPTYLSINQDINDAIYEDTSLDESPYAVWSAWQYAQVNYGWRNATQTLPSDYWNENENRGVAIVSSSTATSKTSSPKTYATPKDTSSTAYYDLTQKGCTTPWGSFVEHGQYVIAYKTSTAVSGRSCEYERRSCSNGKLSGSYIVSKCTSQAKTYTSESWKPSNQQYTQPTIVQRRAACKLPRWGYVADWSYVKAYKSSNSTYSNGCEGEYRFCRNGVLDGSYAYKSCVLVKTESYARNCSLPRWWYIADGQSVWAYSSSFGDCISQRRTCNDGYLHWTYLYRYCNNYTNTNRCSLPRWWTIGDGQSVVAYSSPSGDCTSQTRTCDNGYLKGSYQYGYCTEYTKARCSLPRWWTIGDGQSVVAYSSPSGDCTSQTRTCDNGYLKGSYQYSYCSNTNTNPINPTTDIYGNWENLWRLDGPTSSLDTCGVDLVNEYTCSSNESKTCVDYKKIEDDCCITGRAKYQKRTVMCQ